MRSTSALIVLSIAAILASIAVGSNLLNRNSKTGTLWSVNLGLGGEDLRLFDSGRYESLEWDDLPPNQLIKGVWRQQGELLYLVSDAPQGRIRTFRKIDRFGCTYLQRQGMKVPLDLFPSGITIADLTVEGSGCRDKAQEENELERRGH
jgi:hypothetical protein